MLSDSQNLNFGNLTGYLVTKIKDRGSGFDAKILNKQKHETFAFAKAGTN